MMLHFYSALISVLYVAAAVMALLLSAVVLWRLFCMGCRAFNRVMKHLTYGRWTE